MSISMTLIMGALLFVFHYHAQGGFPHNWGPVRLHLLLWLALGAGSVLVSVLVFRDRDLVDSPLEYLIIFSTIALLFLPVRLKGPFRTDVLALELLSFFACYRVLQRIVSPSVFRQAPLAGVVLLLILLGAGLRPW